MNNSLFEHKTKWNELAQENDRYYVRSVDHDQPDDEYARSGREDVERFLLNDETLCNRFQDLSSHSVLEIGCGSGRMTKSLADIFQYVYAVDISSTMLAKAKKFVNSDNVNFYESDGSNVPVPAQSVEVAYSYIVYQHFPSKDAITKSFEEVWKALKPDGLFKVQIRGLKHPDRKHWSWGPHYSEDEARVLSSQAGFRILNQQGVGERYYWLLLHKPL